jgi:4-hydroxybenzoate polyprenyltransferase
MLSRKNKLLITKALSLFSVVRGYNILVIVIAQYLTSIYILAPQLPLGDVVFDPNLLMLVLASAVAIAGGYIINNFYDSEKDLINRPRKSMLDRLVSQRTKLSVYFVLNFMSVVFASYVSFRAVIFFSAYIFGIWLYSHKFKRITGLGNIIAAMLSVTPFFAVFIYYSNFDTVIFVHATFLFLLLWMREVVKDLENLKGDLTLNYKTVPVVFGENPAKGLITTLCISTLIPIILLLTYYEVGYMDYYFYASGLALIGFLVVLWRSKRKLHYLILHGLLKGIIVLGVFSIVLINVDLILKRFL